MEEKGIFKIDQIPSVIKENMLSLGLDEKTFLSEGMNALEIWNSPKNTYLRKCSKSSFLNALVNLCKIGLSLNPIKKEAYLVPRKNTVYLEPSYIGLVKLLTDAGTVTNIQTNLVYENDTYDEYFDMNGINFKHIPAIKNRGKIIKVYCLAFLTNGNRQFESMLTEEVDKIKENSESYKAYKDPNKKVFSAIWHDYESEMIRKTCLRRIYKYLPRSTGKKSDFINEAIKLDEIAFSASNEQITYIDNLLHSSVLDEPQKQQIESEYNIMTFSGALRCINYLKENQLDPMDMPNPSQTDIQNKIKDKE